MMEEEVSDKGKKANRDTFTDIVFSWSVEDIFNENLYQNQVQEIPLSFFSEHHYFDSFKLPLVEETRAELSSKLQAISRASYAEIESLEETNANGKSCVYDIKVDYWRNNLNDVYRRKHSYRVFPGDVFVLTDAKPEGNSDLEAVLGKKWTLALAETVMEDNVSLKIQASQANVIAAENVIRKHSCLVFLMNIRTNERIWNSLNMNGNLSVVREVLCSEVQKNMRLCSVQQNCCLVKEYDASSLSNLDESQKKAVLDTLGKVQCNCKASVQLIWGPPGTGKTTTLCVLLLNLSRMKCRVLVCAPRNIAVAELGVHFLKLVKESHKTRNAKDSLYHSWGDILVFGNLEGTEAISEIEEIHLEYRVKKLLEVFEPCSGWRKSVRKMIDLVEGCVSGYNFFKNETEMKKISSLNDASKEVSKFFPEFMREKFNSLSLQIKYCISILCTHLPRNFIPDYNFEQISQLVALLDSIELLFSQIYANSEELLDVDFLDSNRIEGGQSVMNTLTLFYLRTKECISSLQALLRFFDRLLPTTMDTSSARDFCFRMASLIFCTCSSSYELHSMIMEPLNLLIIDDAAQLKECELSIPLQLPGLKRAILFGDHCQLSASVSSNVSANAGLARSLFERMILMDVPKNVLDVQYRMHPFISSFPNSKFYANQISDAPNVRRKDYCKHYLPGPLFGTYSFINISCGKEEMDDAQYSRKNMLEVAVVVKIIDNLYKAWKELKQQLSIGITSPSTAQVLEIQERLEDKYKCFDGFKVKVRPIKALQGEEEDIIILSTVRSNRGGSIGLLSDHRITNVALTRARHCLWILGNERALSESESVWTSIVHDAKDHQCFFNVDEDENLMKFIIEVKKELDQFDELLDADSFIFRNARWEVLISQNFKSSFQKIKSFQMKKLVVNLLRMLASGWRPKKRKRNIICELSKQILKQFKVKDLYVVCSVDIVKRSSYIQVLNVWDILPLVEIPDLVKRLDIVFCTYTDKFLNHCKQKFLEGDLEVPLSWEASNDIVRHKSSSDIEGANEFNTEALNRTNSCSSLLQMKFFSLASGIASHLLSSCDGEEIEFPFEPSSEETEIIHFNRSSFVLGRSGTGKTTILIGKLFQKEQLHHIASEGFHELNCCPSKDNKTEDGERAEDIEESHLRQIFVTFSPNLCYAVKQHISGLKRFACGGNSSKESTTARLDDIDGSMEFTDIPDSFIDLPPKLYPLVITFHKFLMMLNGTVGNSFFHRFPEARGPSHGNTRSSKSLALKTFIRMKEVNFDKFKSSYWPHFSMHLPKNLESSTVFTEIMSYIKGKLQTGKACDDKLRRDYISLSNRRVSKLSMEEREIVYDIFLKYEKRKMENGEYDLADLVSDLHHRLRENKYEGDKLDFVYIDEVQDLTMRQISLFKYLCRNVDAGFVFSGDTAQTIARGVDFRFEDIRSLFYEEFVMKSSCEEAYRTSKHVKIADNFQLSQNFRTHAGVLKLAQSVIDLLYYFFPQSIDVLNPETSLIHEKTPVLIESENIEKDFTKMFEAFGGSGNNLTGFGAEQVVLVRDENIKNKILNSIGKHALVLTIMECKGLEFQDVLLYNLLGSSPLKNQWRVIYEYMQERNLLDPDSAKSIQIFNQAKHKLLCFELKQLYVAITRTRQRLWIFETMEEHHKPLFDYWKKLKVVQVGDFHELHVKDIQVTSCKEDWESRGVKLFHECNYESAKMCFQRAGNTVWEELAEAASLRASAQHISSSDTKKAHIYLKKAAKLYISIGKFELAAQCYYESNEYEEAGTIYLEKCGDSRLEEAGECFTRARSYKLAADAYAKGKLYSNCIDACIQGKLFDEGLKYILLRRKDATESKKTKKYIREIEAKEQELLEGAARSYKNLKDNNKMMKFVKAFCSKDLARSFLRNENLLDQLLKLECEWGCFLNAASVAKQIGNLMLEVELLEKAGHFREASLAILLHVFAKSFLAGGSNGWTMVKFAEKQELLDKAKALAKKVSPFFFEFVCLEENIFSEKEVPLSNLMQLFSDSVRLQSVRGEFLCSLKILTVHFDFVCSKYLQNHDLSADLKTHAEGVLSMNQVSVDTLVYFWNIWKQNIGKVFGYLSCPENQSVWGEFCLSYLGVRKQFQKKKVTYILHCSDAYWISKSDYPNLRPKGKSVNLNPDQFANAARNYWSSEMTSAGIKVLEKLRSLYELSTKESLAIHHKSIILIRMFEVANSLIKSKFMHHEYMLKVKDYLELSGDRLFRTIFPLDLRNSSTKNMVNLRGRGEVKNAVREIFNRNISSKSHLSLGEIVNLVMMVMRVSRKLGGELCQQISERSKNHPLWRSCIVSLEENLRLESKPGSSSAISLHPRKHVSLVENFHKALRNTYFSDLITESVSPGCLMYLVERLLLLVFYSQGYFFSTKSTFLEWLIHEDWNPKISRRAAFDWQSRFVTVLDLVAGIVEELLCNEQDAIKWIQSSKISSEFHPVLVLRLFTVLCLLCLNSRKYFELLFKLLENKEISSKLPQQFCRTIQRLKPGYLNANVNVFAEAFGKIGNPLVIVRSRKKCLNFECQNAIFVDLNVDYGRDKLMSIML
ncbi:uncharacterized protein LOC107429676 isoform X2 [Ziziphus jujuba]|uniref:Uncharacterized protein LOC107429676 isoform X2 n=1 Tax=Ziziphus jujuba TaxID=326968 RepID=A0ABM3I2J4_ZIZJJ|nr:uncharacterized protein LOC107429676 isoform X2 [Ziziphus jujuba]